MRLREPLPEWNTEAYWLNSGPIYRSELIGEKPVLIYFWSISCKTCTRGIERVKELFNEYKDQLHIITIHLPRNEHDKNLEAVKQYVEKYQITEPVLIDQDHQVTNQFKNRYVPAFYLFDQTGKLRYVQSGKSTTSLLKKRIVRLVNG